eukprot:522435_1
MMGGEHKSDSELMITTSDTKDDVARNRYPFSVVWGPLPLISWIFPFIGHMGICDSEGRVHDFAGPYTVNTDQFMTGSVKKYTRYDHRRLFPAESADGAKQRWDEAIEKADVVFRGRMHNIICNNCHDHVTYALNEMGSDDRMIPMFVKFTAKSKYVSPWRVLHVYIPFLLIVALILFLTL